MADLATFQPIVRNTFWDLDSDDTEDLPRLRRSYSDHCINYANFDCKADLSDSSTIAGTSESGSVAGRSRAGSEVGSDDAGSWAEMMSGPPGTFTAPGMWTAPTSTSCPALAVQASQTCSSDCQSTSDEGTTVIVRKVSGDASRAAFLDMLDAEGFARQYAFVYVPVNFQKGVALGYAIVNFSKPAIAVAAAERLSGVELSGKQLEATLSDANQSLSDLIHRYRDSAVMHPFVPDDCKPAIFSDGLAVPFPEPTKPLEPPSLTKPKRCNRRSSNSI